MQNFQTSLLKRKKDIFLPIVWNMDQDEVTLRLKPEVSIFGHIFHGKALPPPSISLICNQNLIRTCFCCC